MRFFEVRQRHDACQPGSTVKKHITNILGKLGVSNRTQAAVRARELGLITSD